MKKLFRISGSCVVAAMMLLMSACNGDDESDYIIDPVDYTNTAITAFSLRANKAVLNNLDSVFFSIDLNSAQIFNADSLPYGTDVTSISVSIKAEASAIKAYVQKNAAGDMETIDLIEDEKAKLNFSKGPIRLTVTSLDGEHKRDYSVSVNVHRVVPDSLFWSSLAQTDLPSTFASPTAQKTVKYGDSAYCLTTDGSTYNMAVSANPYANDWQVATVNFGSDVKVQTLTATTDALYILTIDGSLLTSTDGATWAATGMVWNNIIAPYNEQVFGIITDGVSSMYASYPASTTAPLPLDFPVGDYSAAIPFATKWAPDDQIMIFGGTKSNGSKTGATWAFDGATWAKLAESLPAASNYAVASYVVCETDTVTWRLKEQNVLLAFGGRYDTGNINSSVYVSRDLGLTWKKGDAYLQLPEYMPAVYSADVLVFNTLLSDTDEAQASGKRSAWLEMPLLSLPSIYVPEFHKWSRAVSPITSWECPFLYMFGGVDADGRLQNAVWRGVVNHFTFQPLQ